MEKARPFCVLKEVLLISMSSKRTSCSKHHDDDRLKIRFKELAALQRALLDQQSEIELLRVQNRRMALALPSVASDCSAENNLAVARDRIAELEHVQSDLVSAVNEKERQRFTLAIKLQETLILMEETQFVEAPAAPFEEVPLEDTVRQRETLLMQQELLQEREETIIELQDALIRAHEERIESAPFEDLARLGEMLRAQEVELREREEAIAELTTTMQVRPTIIPSQNSDSLLHALMLEYHATTTAALAERDRAILMLTIGSSAGTQHATSV